MLMERAYGKVYHCLESCSVMAALRCEQIRQRASEPDPDPMWKLGCNQWNESLKVTGQHEKQRGLFECTWVSSFSRVT